MSPNSSRSNSNINGDKSGYVTVDLLLEYAMSQRDFDNIPRSSKSPDPSASPSGKKRKNKKKLSDQN